MQKGLLKNLLGLLFFTAIAAQAMPIPMFGVGSELLALNKQDMVKVEAAKKKVIQSGKAGASATWSNSSTGRSGKVTLLRLFTVHGHPCRSIRYHLTYKKQDHASFVVRECRAQDGGWKYVANPVKLVA